MERRPARPPRRGRRGVVAAALPRHGAHRLRARAARCTSVSVVVPAAAPLPEAARQLVPGHHAPQGDDRLRAELRLRALREAHPREGPRRASTSRRGASPAAAPSPFAPRRSRPSARRSARSGFRKEALLPSYGMAEASLAIAFTELGEGMRTLSVDGPTLWGEGRRRGTSPTTTRTPSASCRAARSSRTTRSPSSTRTTRRARRRSRGGTRGRDPHRGAERDGGLLGGRRADARGVRRAVPRTGDLGFLHEGHLYICGRSKEVVIVNGRNYYPQDMEWEASKVAGVRKGNVIAFGARDPSGDRARPRARRGRVRGAGRRTSPARAQAVAQEVRKAVQEGMGLTLDDVVPVAPGALPEDVERQAAARARPASCTRGASSSAARGKGDASKVELVKQRRAEPAELLQARGARWAEEQEQVVALHDAVAAAGLGASDVPHARARERVGSGSWSGVVGLMLAT